MKFLKIFVVFALFLSFSFAESANKELTFTLKDLNQNTYHITDKADGMDIKELKGKVVFLAFFGHRCPPCRMEIPGFISFTKDKEYAKKAVILAVEVQGLSRDGVKNFVKEQGINYIVVPGEENIDFINYVGYRTNWNNGIPFMVVIDQNGKVVNFGNGIISEEEIKSIVDELTEQNKTKDTNTTN